MLIPCTLVHIMIIMLQVTILSTRNKPIVKDVISPPTACRVLCVRLGVVVVVAVVAYFNNGAKVVLQSPPPPPRISTNTALRSDARLVPKNSDVVVRSLESLLLLFFYRAHKKKNCFLRLLHYGGVTADQCCCLRISIKPNVRFVIFRR